LRAPPEKPPRPPNPIYERALSLDPANQTALWNLALLQETQDKFDDALRLYRRLIESHPAHGPAWLAIAEREASSGNLEAALQAWRRVSENAIPAPALAAEYFSPSPGLGENH